MREWEVTFGQPETGQLTGFSYGSTLMERNDERNLETGERIVDLVVTPLLRHRGNSLGLEFDRIEQIVKLKVTVDWTL